MVLVIFPFSWDPCPVAIVGDSSPLFDKLALWIGFKASSIVFKVQDTSSINKVVFFEPTLKQFTSWNVKVHASSVHLIFSALNQKVILGKAGIYLLILFFAWYFWRFNLFYLTKVERWLGSDDLNLDYGLIICRCAFFEYFLILSSDDIVKWTHVNSGFIGVFSGLAYLCQKFLLFCT